MPARHFMLVNTDFYSDSINKTDRYQSLLVTAEHRNL